jgi:signal transduction histidine kinase
MSNTMTRLRTALQARLCPEGRSVLGGYVAALLLPIAALLVVERLLLPAFVFEHVIVLLVVGCAVRWGLRPAVVTAITAVAADNVLLREPIGQPAITGVRDLIDLMLFVIVAVTVGWLVAKTRADRIRAEKATAQERQAKETRDRLIATISHDLATPLSIIQGSVQFAQRSGGDTSVDMGRLLVRLETAASRATSLLETLRDTQALERGDDLSLRKIAADLRDVVLPIVHLYDRISDRHPVVVSAPDVPLMVHADPARIQRVIENLLSNAIKYSPQGGAVQVSLVADGNDAVVTVRDHGMGICAEVIPHIFEASFRAPEAVAAAPGLGLGLSISMEIARRHGGNIEVSPAEPKGCLFALRLPLNRSAAVRDRSHARHAATSGVSLH